MTKTAREILKRALELSEKERLALAQSLVDSVPDDDDDPEEVASAWKREITKRVRETLRAGDSAPGDDWSVVRARLERKLRPAGFRESRGQDGRLTHLDADAGLQLIRGLPVLDFDRGVIEPL